MSKLDDVMVNRELSNVSQMLYSYMYKSTGDEEVVITEDGFERMFEAVVSGVGDSAKVYFNEILEKGLIKLHSKEDDDTFVYSLVK